MSIWDRFEGIVKAEDVVEAKAKFSPMKAGIYTAKLEKCEAGENKFSFAPELQLQWRTDTNRVIFHNQSLQVPSRPDLTPMLITITNDIVNNINGTDIDFTTIADLESRINQIVVGGEHELELTYDDNKDPDHKYPRIKLLANKTESEDVPF